MFTHSFAKRPEIVVNLPPGVSISENCQIVIAFTPEETAVAMEFGPTRVIGQLGSSVAWFPEPRWIDRDRSSCCTMADQATSIRREIKIARIPGLNTLWVNDDITLTFPAGDTKKRIIQAAFRDLSTQHLFGFDCFMNENADCGLTWKAGQMKRPVGYGVSGYVILLLFSSWGWSFQSQPSYAYAMLIVIRLPCSGGSATTSIVPS